MSTTNIQAFSGDVEVAGGLNVTGTMTSTTGVDKVTLATNASDANRPVVFATGTTGAQNLRTDPGLTYNPANNYLNTTANHAQDADYANDAGNVYASSRDANNTNVQYMLFTDSHADGQKALYTDSNAYYNPANNLIGANVSGRANHAQDADYANHAQDADAANRANHAQDADYAGDAGNVYAASRDTENTNVQYILFTTSHSDGQKALYTDNGLCYNPNSEAINANLAGRANHAQDADYAGDAGNVYTASRDSNNSNAQYMLFTTSHADGQKTLYTDANAYYNPANSYLNVNVNSANRANHAQDADAANRANHAQDVDRANVLGNYVHITSFGESSNKVTLLRMTEDDDLTYFRFRNQQSVLNREIQAYCQGYFQNASDDRLKVNERYLTDGLDVIKRLKPQVYDKRPDLVENLIDQGYDSNTIETKEVGFIAQDIYYQVPELKHIVNVGGSGTPASNVVIGDDPAVDPDYSSWGNVAAGIHITEVIPYNTAAIQELSNLRDLDIDRITVLESQVSDLLSRVQTLESGGS
jgi:hypothetical protein